MNNRMSIEEIEKKIDEMKAEHGRLVSMNPRYIARDRVDAIIADFDHIIEVSWTSQKHMTNKYGRVIPTVVSRVYGRLSGEIEAAKKSLEKQGVEY